LSLRKEIKEKEKTAEALAAVINQDKDSLLKNLMFPAAYTKKC